MDWIDAVFRKGIAFKFHLHLSRKFISNVGPNINSVGVSLILGYHSIFKMIPELGDIRLSRFDQRRLRGRRDQIAHCERQAASRTFLETEPQVLAYTLDGSIVGDERFIIAVNTDTAEHTLALPDGDWSVLVNGTTAGPNVQYGIDTQTFTLEPQSGYVLVNTQSDIPAPAPGEQTQGEPTTGEPTNDSGVATATAQPMPGWLLAVISGGTTLTMIAVAAAAVYAVKRFRKR